MKIQDIKGLHELICSPQYRESLNLPQEMLEEYKFLAAGEYNCNFVFFHPNLSKKYILRVEFGSQMHLDNQINYEYNALKFLEISGKTPKPYFVDGSKKICERGVLVEEFIEGNHLDYQNDLHLEIACDIFADIHSLNIQENIGILKVDNPYLSMFEECQAMYAEYKQSNKCKKQVCNEIDRLMNEAYAIAKSAASPDYFSVINTEVNNTNFLIGGKVGYLVDWEKPLISDPAQDIGHFLADTTTFWKTDFFFTKEKKQEFVKNYIDKLPYKSNKKSLEKRCIEFSNYTCLRGITWCAMASAQYADSSKQLIDEVTLSKFDHYLDFEYLKSLTL